MLLLNTSTRERLVQTDWDRWTRVTVVEMWHIKALLSSPKLKVYLFTYIISVFLITETCLQENLTIVENLRLTFFSQQTHRSNVVQRKAIAEVLSGFADKVQQNWTLTSNTLTSKTQIQCLLIRCLLLQCFLGLSWGLWLLSKMSCTFEYKMISCQGNVPTSNMIFTFRTVTIHFNPANFTPLLYVIKHNKVSSYMRIMDVEALHCMLWCSYLRIHYILHEKALILTVYHGLLLKEK